MALVSHIFDGVDFFNDIRSTPEWTTHRGLFPGIDGRKHYVVMDAIFYRLNIFIRPSTSRFTTSAIARHASFPNSRVVANGQFFGPVGGGTAGLAWINAQASYCHNDPCPIDWQGEVLNSHSIVRTGNPPSRSRFYHFGQFDGTSVSAYDIARGNPSAVTRDSGYRSALGTLLPLIVGRVRATPAQLGSFWSAPASDGKTCYGIHRNSNTVFVFVEEDGAGSITIPNLITLLERMGVDEAVLGDCGSSSTLIFDGVVEVTPGGSFDRKDKSIPDGPEFSLTDLSIGSRSEIRLNVSRTTHPRFLVNNPSQNPLFYSNQTVVGFSGNLSFQATGLRLVINSFGMGDDPSSSTSGTLEAADVLGLSLPFTLTASATNLANTTIFTNGASSVTAEASLRHIVSNSADLGSLEGSLIINGTEGTITLDINLNII